MVLSTRGRCNDVEQGNIAWTKNLYFEIPTCADLSAFSSGMTIASLPRQKILFTFLSVVQHKLKKGKWESNFHIIKFSN